METTHKRQTLKTVRSEIVQATIAAQTEAKPSDSEAEKSETVVFAGNSVRYPTKTVSGGMHVRVHRGISHVFLQS